MKSRTIQDSAAELGDKTCIYCGASLAGLKTSDRCPGCGKLALDSLLGDNLRDAEAPWLRLLLRGMLLAAIAYGLLSVYHLITIADHFAHREFELSFYGLFVLIGGWGLMAVGCWMLTEREPTDALVARRRGVAWTIRLATILATLAPLVLPRLVPVLHPGGVNTIEQGQSLYRTLVAFGLLEALFVVVSCSLVWLHLRRLIERTPRREVRRLLTTMFLASWPVTAIASRGVLSRLLLHTNLPADTVMLMVNVVGPAVLIIHHAFAAYLLILSGKVVRRTIGDWT